MVAASERTSAAMSAAISNLARVCIMLCSLSWICGCCTRPRWGTQPYGTPWLVRRDAQDAGPLPYRVLHRVPHGHARTTSLTAGKPVCQEMARASASPAARSVYHERYRGKRSCARLSLSPWLRTRDVRWVLSRRRSISRRPSACGLDPAGCHFMPLRLICCRKPSLLWSAVAEVDVGADLGAGLVDRLQLLAPDAAECELGQPGLDEG